MMRYSFLLLGLITSLGMMLSTSLAQTTVVINEIMANPNNGQLPAYEYIELFNNGQEVARLEEYEIRIGSLSVALPPYRLSPRQYVLLCDSRSLPQFETFGNALALGRWLPLNNTGATVSLVRDDAVVDKVSYSDRWYGSSAKRNGGWSLERINPNVACDISSNWTASTHPIGGTPAKPNAVANHARIPEVYVDRVELQESRLVLFWNISLEHLSFDRSDFDVVPNLGAPTRVDIAPSKDSMFLYFDTGIQENTVYHLRCGNMRWCLQDVVLEDILVFRQGTVRYNDVVINEILFNPKAGGVDFVEIFNRSSYPIDLQHWKLGNRTISSGMLLIHPGQHLALTTDPGTVLRHYPTTGKQHIQAVPSLPAYTNQQGTVTLFSPTVLVDSLYYHADMHDSFLKDVKGISLERQSPNTPTDAAGNFRSASTLAGGATPGYQNSTQKDFFSKKNKIFLSSKTVSPDQDGFEDLLEINYEFVAPDYMINVDIFSENGRLVKRLIRQQSAGLSGTVVWDTRTDSGDLAANGIYIFVAEIYDQKGARELKKGGFVVTR